MSRLPSEQAKAEAGASSNVAGRGGASAASIATLPTERSPLGIYVHVPFCASTCDFCAFYQQQPTASDVSRFLAGIAREAEFVNWTQPVTTVFWGGGTPGILAPRHLEQLAEIVRMRCGGAPEEWTVELAPGSVTDARLAVLRAAGVTRVSMGVQSFQPALLDALGRQHTREQVFTAYDRVRAAGFHSVNLDLMFALPGQTAEEWAADVREAVSLAPDHLSTYCLTFEEDTKLWVKLSQGRVKLDPDFEATLYQATWAQLEDSGFAQYEISNFARPGHACLHNVNTWRMHEWVGLGPSAASQHAGMRGANIADLEKWLGHLERGERATEDRVTLSASLLAEDALIFGLRMNAGVDLDPWRRRAPDAPWPMVEDTLATLAAAELLVRDGDVVRLTNRGRLIADSVGAEIMAAFDPIIETA
jgi:oxygen-independent coproporphyrinogen-3 oxidase